MSDKYSNLQNATIMMVDDEVLTMEMVKHFLEEEGYTEFHLEEHSSRALQTLENVKPDILLLDLVMPEVSGFELLAKIRKLPRYEYLPIIILTSENTTESKLRSLDLGATDFLAKPVDSSELKLRLRNTLAAKAYIDQLAYYDTLTQLPNRLMFQEQFERALKKAERYQENMALMNIGLDDFGRINASIGIKGGDDVIAQLARRIEGVVRDSDDLSNLLPKLGLEMNLFRTEGGAFLLLLERLKDNANAALVAKRLLETIRRPLQCGAKIIHPKASIGIATFPDEAKDTQSLQQKASNASEYVRRNGGDNFQFSDHEINDIYEKRLDVENKLRQALRSHEFVLHYQPKIDTLSGAVRGVEALLRWQRDASGLVPPNEFIPLAEETGLIVPIGSWVLTEACTQLKHWNRLGHSSIGMNVNLSIKQFDHPNFLDEMKQILADSGIEPGFLTLEFTESLFIEKIEEKIEKLVELKKLGVKLSIDDFGTGYSSLSYLKRLPVDELKIDRSFIQDIPDRQDGCAVVSTIIYLAEKFGLETVAEGVETREQFYFLRSEGCRQLQGFLFSRPLPAEALYEKLLQPRKQAVNQY